MENQKGERKKEQKRSEKPKGRNGRDTPFKFPAARLLHTRTYAHQGQHSQLVSTRASQRPRRNLWLRRGHMHHQSLLAMKPCFQSKNRDDVVVLVVHLLINWWQDACKIATAMETRTSSLGKDTISLILVEKKGERERKYVEVRTSVRSYKLDPRSFASLHGPI